uniref:Neur_chan_LBD domain-containing protein n=1 Tax=Caenorhabditis tropicalis TaxID=1561998 RepID=A0A1I7U5H8_9PELO
MSLVPYTFPLFNLPFVALQHVADSWNPFEILENELYWLEEEIVIDAPNGKLATIQMRQHVGSMEYAKENWHSDYENPVVKHNKVHSNEVYLIVN